VAVLQGLDLKDLPETFRATFLGAAFALPKFWNPPPRDMPRSTADDAEGEDESWDSADSDDSDDSEEEDAAAALKEASDGRRRVATRSDDGSNPDGSRDVSSDSDSDASDASDALDARGLRPEFVTQLVEAFRFVDTDNGGDIDENELKFAARALGFEPDPRELKAMLAAMDEDGGGTVDLGEFVGTVAARVREVTSEAALDDGFDAFDADGKGFIVLEDVAAVAKRLGDNVTSEELDALMDLGAADLNDDGEIDRDEFARIMDFRAVGPGRRRAAIREEIKRQARAASEAEVVAEMLGEYGRRRGGGARTGDADADVDPSPLRASLVAVFASILGPGRDPSSGAEIDVRDLIDALRRDGDGDGSLAKMLHLPSRIRADDGSAAAFEKIFREIDADGSGAIDVEEFVEYFRNLKKEKAMEIVARAISRFEEVDEEEEEEGEV
jgi:Ca2+-binding EF-hand superfamily protein